MSFVAKAAQSKVDSANSHDYLARQVERYRRLFKLSVLTVIATICVISGFFLGKQFKNNASVSVGEPVIVQGQTDTVRDSNDVPIALSEAQQSKVTEDKNDSQRLPQVKPISISDGQEQQHYQWLTIQVGVDKTGQPIYQQQLVPVDAKGAVVINAGTHVLQPSSTAMPANSIVDSEKDLTAGEELSNLAAQGYRIVGKPLESISNETANIDFEGVSPELQAAFNDAVASTENRPSQRVMTATNQSARATPVEQLPDGIQAMLPPIKYLTHIYSTEPSNRLIKINGKELAEGQRIGALYVKEITPDLTVFEFDGIEFSMEAMQDWPAR
ncbi:General secretion pathway protein B [Pseudoalteromonas luteoviolacea B = ATCC 29581]|nr:General secretion pathway protein B [Pseudoalteromonas luteoviolacea B = ATCC 29581]